MNEAKRLKMLWKKLMKLLKDTWKSYWEYYQKYGAFHPEYITTWFPLYRHPWSLNGIQSNDDNQNKVK